MLDGGNSAGIKREYPDVAAFDTGQITVAAFVRPGSTTASQRYINRSNNTVSAGMWQLGVSATAARFRFLANFGGSNRSANDTVNFSVGTLYHLCGRYDGSGVSCWKNGSQVGFVGQSGSLASLAIPITIFESNDSATQRAINTDVAELGVWNVALSSDEIASLAAGVSPLLVRPTALILYDPCFLDSSDRIQGAKVDSGALAEVAHPRILSPRRFRSPRKLTVSGGGDTAAGVQGIATGAPSIGQITPATDVVAPVQALACGAPSVAQIAPATDSVAGVQAIVCGAPTVEQITASESGPGETAAGVQAIVAGAPTIGQVAPSTNAVASLHGVVCGAPVLGQIAPAINVVTGTQGIACGAPTIATIAPAVDVVAGLLALLTGAPSVGAISPTAGPGGPVATAVLRLGMRAAAPIRMRSAPCVVPMRPE